MPRAGAAGLCYASAKVDSNYKLYLGNNLSILHEHLPEASVDLIYLDLPFAKERHGSGGRNGQEDRAVPNVAARRNKEEEPVNRQGRKGENVKKSSWDAYLEQQLKKPKVRRAFEEEKRVLNIGICLAKERKRKGLTQEEVAKQIGTSAPQVSRT